MHELSPPEPGSSRPGKRPTAEAIAGMVRGRVAAREGKEERP